MQRKSGASSSIPRREFLKVSATTVGMGAAAGGLAAVQNAAAAEPQRPRRRRRAASSTDQNREYNGEYAGEHLNRVAFPLGGIGAGMICLDGSGAFSHVSLRHHMDAFNEPCIFAAVAIKGAPNLARTLQGPVPEWKFFGAANSANGGRGAIFGLPRFHNASFVAHFPFATLRLSDEQMPLEVEITAWSPFEPNEADDSSLPVAGLEYKFTNRSSEPVEAVFSLNSKNFMGVSKENQGVTRTLPNGFVLQCNGGEKQPWDSGAFSATVDAEGAKVNGIWFRGAWFDCLTIAWKEIAEAACYDRPTTPRGQRSPGATLFVPVALGPGQSKTIVVRLAWYVGDTNLRIGGDPGGKKTVPGFHRPWYAGRFADIDEVNAYWAKNYNRLRQNTKRFSDCFYDSTLPPEVVEAVAANLTILKTPTVFRQTDGRLWGWEGCCDCAGCCHGSCTHVWNYAQAVPHLFPALERTLRETEFGPSQDKNGHQTFRASLPIRPTGHSFHAASDGQLGGIMKMYREWRVSGDTEWLRGLWPKVTASLDYCIRTWDPKHNGVLVEPHHNTYDIEFWGPDPMCTSFYLGALHAATLMGKALDKDVSQYADLSEKGLQFVESNLFDGEYFVQNIQWQNLVANDPTHPSQNSLVGKYSPEAEALLAKEGPKYQYGVGCLSDGVLGSWMALACGVGQVLDRKKVAAHLKAIHRYNLKKDLFDHVNPQRPTFACGHEGGLLLCSWPKGGRLSLPFVYSNEVWTGIEYQVASHLMMLGMVDEGLEIVRTARDRYDGRVRNPFDEYECGHWYARAMSSYGLLQGLTGIRYDAVEKTLYLQPAIQSDFRSFLSTATGYGTAGVKNGKPFVEVKHGTIDVREVKLLPSV
jgi:uncharacterized protein (DUF608 family)